MTGVALLTVVLQHGDPERRPSHRVEQIDVVAYLRPGL
jgi:hypothetical protein